MNIGYIMIIENKPDKAEKPIRTSETNKIYLKQIRVYINKYKHVG